MPATITDSVWRSTMAPGPNVVMTWLGRTSPMARVISSNVSFLEIERGGRFDFAQGARSHPDAFVIRARRPQKDARVLRGLPVAVKPAITQEVFGEVRPIIS